MTYRPRLLDWNAEVPDRGMFAQVCYALASQLRELPEMPTAAELLEVMGEYTAVHLAQVYENLGIEVDLGEVEWVVFADAIRAAGGRLAEN